MSFGPAGGAGAMEVGFMAYATFAAPNALNSLLGQPGIAPVVISGAAGMIDSLRRFATILPHDDDWAHLSDAIERLRAVCEGKGIGRSSKIRKELGNVGGFLRAVPSDQFRAGVDRLSIFSSSPRARWLASTAVDPYNREAMREKRRDVVFNLSTLLTILLDATGDEKIDPSSISEKQLRQLAGLGDSDSLEAVTISDLVLHLTQTTEYPDDIAWRLTQIFGEVEDIFLSFSGATASRLIEALHLKVINGRIEPAHFSTVVSRFLQGQSLAEEATFIANRSTAAEVQDYYTHSNYRAVPVAHVDADLMVDFDQRQISGTAVYTLKRQNERKLLLDTDSLKVRRVWVELKEKPGEWVAAEFELREAKKHVGRALLIYLPEGVSRVRVAYETDPENIPAGLQWLSPEQTASGNKPFLFTQGQYYYNRGWIPLQDAPLAKMTMAAKLRVKSDLGLRAVMVSNQNHGGFSQMPKKEGEHDVWDFAVDKPFSPYLLAFAVGEMDSVSISDQSILYVDPTLKEKAVADFGVYRRFVEEAEHLFGPIPWEVVDTVILPRSFPFGGMENLGVNFDSPTIITGDGSLMDVALHELIHSWFGNMVTNADLSGFWINEGFTMWAQRKVYREIFGDEAYQMDAIEGIGRIAPYLQEPGGAPKTALGVNLNLEDPEDAVTPVPYEKGFLFLTWLERKIGEEAFLGFVRQYLNHFAFGNLTTADFVQFLKEKTDLKAADISETDLDGWLYGPGIPLGAPKFESAQMSRVEEEAKVWIEKQAPDFASLEVSSWNWQMWVHFLGILGEAKTLSQAALRVLAETHHLDQSQNAEVASMWFQLVAKNRYQPSYPAMFSFLDGRIGRMKFIVPIFKKWVLAGEKELALQIYEKMKSKLHPIARSQIEKAIGYNA